MCGIAGFVDFGGLVRDEALARVRRMTDAIPHRGPDADGFFVDPLVALGHRRLAIVDVAAGLQPMAAVRVRPGPSVAASSPLPAGRQARWAAFQP